MHAVFVALEGAASRLREVSYWFREQAVSWLREE